MNTQLKLVDQKHLQFVHQKYVVFQDYWDQKAKEDQSIDLFPIILSKQDFEQFQVLVDLSSFAKFQ